MKKCDYCFEEIQEEAKICRWCHSDLTGAMQRLAVALQTRQFEIGLFWRRSLFFWGFIAAAFVAIAALKTPTLSLLVSGFGMVCSLAWTLTNRGSKYWQEQWESKIGKDCVIGPFFRQREARQEKGWWLGGKRYSVSKLAIAVSDYVFLVWVAIFARQAWISLSVSCLGGCWRPAVMMMCLLPLFYLGLTIGFGRGGLDQ